MSKIDYSAVVLSDNSKERLLKKFDGLIPDGWEITADHMTINMGEINPELEKYLGLTLYLKINSFAHDDKIMAVGVSGFPTKNTQPHITIAYDKQNGAKAKMSNDLTDWHPIKRPLSLTGKVTEVSHKFN